ncbi:MAG TPA: UDP-N-acetylmuramoyl-L-alanyl-D-glutamate--2,6-diaminopimelate ligase [Accumulibacter sp.]|jgi:UDP-N-acetylmuramoyl-L-alanyl-D-glutamate--2,6-diaminopimelate ligase|nr:UDP-N-acetylmuramoyl-L-alanyl-D-glutamate--2,6-diaminopimelate ligase [Accumulibacter sp.]HQC80227.1 UDP-N-acetylmuramoyl-L-alanyl-D-glutamate--2,6-diaminopimelate ligase [Accumulibacter sp.]
MAPTSDTSAAYIERLATLGVLPGGVTDDSRQVRHGDLFLAYPGEHADGRRYIAEAIANGAAAVLWESTPGKDDAFVWQSTWGVTNLPVPGLRALCGPLAHIVYGRPSERLPLLAVTGTNGKTSVSQWIAQAHPRRCGVIGTLGAGVAGDLHETGFTTPGAATLMRYLAEFSESGVQACALEASSIGIAEGRLAGARVDVAAFTNLSRDHLDYHGTMEAYAQAKAKLFTWPKLRLAICNLDDPFGVELAALTTATKVIGYTQQATSDNRLGTIRAENIAETLDGLRFRLCAPNGRAIVETRLLGRYNISNLLAVAAVLIDAGLTPKDIAGRFAALTSPPGRLERVGGNNEPLVVVDYAHTPDALRNALSALRPMATARGAGLTVIFGCGGDRDRGKRPIMGHIATQHADHVVLSSDNPRSENALAILEEIAAGAPKADILVDRKEAIRQTVLAAHPADVILIAGKGHEHYQEIAGVRQPFSDIAEARAALAARPVASS